MARRPWIVLGMLAGLCGLGPLSAIGAEEFAFFHENVLGTSLELRVRAEHAEGASWAEDRVLREVDRLAAIFSNHDPASEFRRWLAAPHRPMNVSAELFAILTASDHWRERTGGAFDPRADAFSRLWAGTAREDRPPTSDELKRAVALASPPAWRLNADAQSIERLSDCPLTLDAIAKGYIVERACAAALDRSRGVVGLLLNVGGDLRVCGDFPRTIGIAPPRGDSEATEPFAFLEVRDRSVATSGNSQRGYRIAGRWYSHIIDPKTGQPAGRVVNATVVAPNGADADALATAFNILPVEESLRLADALPDVACLLVSDDGRVSRSRGWGRIERPNPLLAAANNTLQATKSVDGSWGSQYELVVRFEINQPETQRGRYRRPYVVVWAEDKRGTAIRTLSLWVSLGGSGPDRWLPDLKQWYRGEESEKTIEKKNMVYTIARPTRPPGSYSVIWDGKDDKGKAVPPGEYTLFIESAREHGSHQLIRKEITVAETPFTAELKGGEEIKAASIEYRRKKAAK